MEEGNRGVVHREVGPTPFLPSSSSAASSMSFLSRRILREPMVLEMDAATHELLEERPIGWGYSRPVVILDVVWNMAFVAVSAVVVGSTLWERPSKPLRAWLSGYAFQCVLHVVFVIAEYRRRIRARRMGEEELLLLAQASLVKRLESLNTMVSFLWWVLGFYWVMSGGQALMQDASRLYWLAVVFLAFDVFFALFCIMLAFIIGVALCCCLPCVIAILYTVAGQQGASDAELGILPKFRFRSNDRQGKFDLDRQHSVVMTIPAPSTEELLDELSLSPEDSECCICLNRYEEGIELHSLPCKHHFHSKCIVKWLRINATCPLCKYNITRGNEQQA